MCDICCYNYKKKRINQAIKLLENAIYNDDAKYMIDTIEYTDGLHINYIFKSKILENNYKISPINYACRCNSINCIKSLIKNGANINMYDQRGWLPIHYASIYHEKYNNVSLKLVLSSQYANIDLKTKGGKIVIYNNVKLNTKNKTAFELANHYLCYGSCKVIKNYILNKNKLKNKLIDKNKINKINNINKVNNNNNLVNRIKIKNKPKIKIKNKPKIRNKSKVKIFNLPVAPMAVPYNLTGPPSKL